MWGRADLVAPEGGPNNHPELREDVLANQKLTATIPLTAGDEPGNMRRVKQQQGPYGIGDPPERCGVDHPRVRSRTGNDQFGPVLLGKVRQIGDKALKPGDTAKN